jgi:hypothetical protein
MRTWMRNFVSLRLLRTSARRVTCLPPFLDWNFCAPTTWTGLLMNNKYFDFEQAQPSVADVCSSVQAYLCRCTRQRGRRLRSLPFVVRVCVLLGAALSAPLYTSTLRVTGLRRRAPVLIPSKVGAVQAWCHDPTQ